MKTFLILSLANIIFVLFNLVILVIYTFHNIYLIVTTQGSPSEDFKSHPCETD